MKGRKLMKGFMIAMMMMLSIATVQAEDTNVTFDGDSEDFIFLDGSQDLFDNFKNIMPGETRVQKIKLHNDDHREMKFYLSVDVLDSLDVDTSGYSVYTISIENNGEEFYNGTLDDLAALSAGSMSEDTMLAELSKGESTEITMTLYVDGDSMDNTYQNKEGMVQFNFSVEEEDDPVTIIEVVKKVFTGDNTNVAALLGLVVVSAVLIIFFVVKKKKEGNSND